ncbi:N-acetylneuraminate synthase [Neorhodopirellula lusitana]|uniref:N-acetylneuraminate synthase n=1 Tax=Neorhodopirellula lusitana TaxID=445327 RepID=A0ABY1PYD1_9BACT|nr:N-acetylneuraminate synthase [Neorhodopirellula lusitana]SMP47694.1 N-acetylneuraminate synthase [Neorhodopirellula lusitana]
MDARLELNAVSRCFIIAEAGVNHNGCLDRALALIDAAKAAGADAVKFQTFHSDEIAVADAPKCEYQTRGSDANETQQEMLRRLELSEQDHRTLADHCQAIGIEFMSTAFDINSVDLLVDLGVQRFKIPSGELTNLPLIQRVAQEQCEMFISTGMSSLGEVEQAVEMAEASGGKITLLHCVSAYPAPLEEVNLRSMKTLGDAFHLPIGFSDHTAGITVAPAAVALGACVVEKHFTLDRSLPGPDHAASLEVPELTQMISAIREVEIAMGSPRKQATTSERETADVARRSLVAARDIDAGERIDESCIALRRPGTGMPPHMRIHVAGKTARRAIAAGTMLQFSDVA